MPEEKQFGRRRKIKNETKNIPKNFGKAIINFVMKNSPERRAVLHEHNVDEDLFLRDLSQRRGRISTIEGLRGLWTSMGNDGHSKCMRILSNLFLRRYGLQYIFNSRIKQTQVHIKYLRKLLQAVKNPELFHNIKDY